MLLTFLKRPDFRFLSGELVVHLRRPRIRAPVEHGTTRCSRTLGHVRDEDAIPGHRGACLVQESYLVWQT